MPEHDVTSKKTIPAIDDLLTRMTAVEQSAAANQSAHAANTAAIAALDVRVTALEQAGPPPPPPPPPPGTQHAYRAWKTQAEINADTNSDLAGGDNPQVTYDPSLDAARVDLPVDGETLTSSNNLRFNYPRVDTGTLLAQWDWRFGPDWQTHRNEIDILKSYQLSNTTPPNPDTFTTWNGNPMSPGNRRLEVRHIFESKSWHPQLQPGDAAFVDVRGDYLDAHSAAANTYSDAIANTLHFISQPSVWQRYWMLVDFDAKTASFWMADENNDAIAVFEDAPLPRITGVQPAEANGLDGFWLEWHGTALRTGPAVTLGWVRDVYIYINTLSTLTRPT